MNPVEKAIRRAAGLQQRHTATAFPFGVIKKFGDDNGGAPLSNLASTGFAGGLFWTVLQAFGAFLVHHYLRSDSVYGIFATVLGLVAWIYFTARGPQARSMRRKVISCSSSRTAAAAGMATSAPTRPSSAAPISTATTVTAAGTCTVRPMIRGTSR